MEFVKDFSKPDAKLVAFLLQMQSWLVTVSTGVLLYSCQPAFGGGGWKFCVWNKRTFQKMIQTSPQMEKSD